MNSNHKVKFNQSKRSLATLLSVLLLICSAPVDPAFARTTDVRKSTTTKPAVAAPLARKAASAKETAAAVKPTHHRFAISATAPDSDITRVRLFPEMLVPMTGVAVPGENAALAKALAAFKAKQDVENVTDLTAFLKQYPNSRWRASLELNIGLRRSECGYLSEALSYWKSAFAKSNSEKSLPQKLVADRALAELLTLGAKLGRLDELRGFIVQADERHLQGGDAQKLDSAKQALYAMERSPNIAYKCGPYALNTILFLNRKSKAEDPKVKAFASSSQGTNLAQLKDLSDQLSLGYQMAKRSKGADFVTPSVMHWKAGHFAAITQLYNGRYHVQDPTFGNAGTVWLTPAALEAESDGYFLVPPGQLPNGWTSVSREDGEKIWGKGYPTHRNEGKPPTNPQQCMGTNCCGMARASAWTMQAELNIQDTPVSYSPPIGPRMDFSVNYNQNEEGAQALAPFTNVSSNWALNWVSHVTVDASRNATVYVRGGGNEIYNYSLPDNVGNSYAPALTSQAIVTLANNIFQRLLPDGSIEVFGFSDDAGNYFMTQVIDPQGNAATINWDTTNFRITSIDDATGLRTNFTYVSNSVGNSGYYRVSQITDPFGRTASFAYDGLNTNLLTITDAVALTSNFSYGDATFITSMTTPYGTTSFQAYTPVGGVELPRGLRFVFPDGTKSVIENWIGEDKMTYFWDRHAMSLYPNDATSTPPVYSHCVQTKFLFDAANMSLAPVQNWIKPPLEAQVTYTTEGETRGNYLGSSNRPTMITRTLNGNPGINLSFTGSATAGDTITLTAFNPTFSGGQQSASYPVQAGDTLSTIATGFAQNINTAMSSGSVIATASGPNIYLQSTSTSPTTYSTTASAGATEVMELSQNGNPAWTAAVGSATAGGTLTITVTDSGLPSGSKAVTYTVKTGDTDNTAATGLAAALNADSNLQAIGVVASASTNNVRLQSFSGNATSYGASTTGGPTLNLSLLVQTQIWQYQYNAFGHATHSVDPLGRTFEYKYSANNVDLLEVRETTTNALLGKLQYNTQHRPVAYIDGSGRKTQYAYNSYGQLTSVTDALSNVTQLTYGALTTATFGGSTSGGNALSITITDPAIQSGTPQVINYTTVSGDTPTKVAAKFADLINANANLQTVQAARVAASAYGTILTMSSSSVNTSYSKSDSGITITLTNSTSGTFLVKVDGPLSSADYSTFNWNGSGNVASSANSENYIRRYSYDALNRLVKTIYPDGTTDQTVYERLDPVAFIDRLGRTSQASYDSMDQMISQIDPLGRKTSYEWCTCGSLISLTDPSNHVTTWSHDLEGRVTRKTYADTKHLDYVYEATTSRLASRTNARGIATAYAYALDNRLLSIDYGDSTPDVTITYDGTFPRVHTYATAGGSAQTYTYAYNAYITDPFGTPTTGGGRLASITNSLVSNSTITFSYDELARVTNRQINGSANSITWGYDAISRIQSEQNALGTFNYDYVDESTPDKGTFRLAQVSYPSANGQVTKYGWYSSTFDERLQQISNLKSDSTALSQFNYAFDPAGQITTWVQQQATNHPNIGLGYDLAGQLIAAQSGNGVSAPSFVGQAYFNYDPAANRTAVHQSNIRYAKIGGTVTATDVITLTVKDPVLSGGQRAVSYTVVATDTTTSIAAALAAVVSGDAQLQAAGINATSNGSTTSLKSLSSNITTYTAAVTGGTPTEIVTIGNNNSIQNVTVGGTLHTGDNLTITIRDPGLTGSPVSKSHTVAGGDTPTSIATTLRTAINNDANLTGAGITANSLNQVIAIQSISPNVTTYTTSVSGGGATTTLTNGTSLNGTKTALIGGSKTTADALTITVFDQGLSGGSRAVTYNVGSGDNLNTITSGLAGAINGDTNLQAIGVTASSSGTVLSLTSVSTNATTYLSSKSAGATENFLWGLAANGVQTAAIGGTRTTGDVLTLTAYDAGIGGGSQAVPYTVLVTDTDLNLVATNFAAAITTALNGNGITASAVTSPTLAFNPVINITSTSTNATTYTKSLSGGATETITLGTNVGVSQAVHNNVNQVTGLAAGGSTRFQGTTNKAMQSLVVMPGSAVVNLTQWTPNTTGYAQSTSSGATIITLGTSGPNETATIGGTKTTGQVLTLTFTTTAIGGSHSVNYTIQAGDTNLTDVAVHFTDAINADQTLQSAGISATSASTVITISNQTTFTSAVTGTETISLGTAVDGTVTATIGGTKTTGDVLSIVVHDPRLPGGFESADYTVQSADNLTTIAAGLIAAVNADSKLRLLGVSSPTGFTLNTPLNFTANPSLSSGNNTATITAKDGAGTVLTNTYQFSAMGTSVSGIAYDADGNMTTDAAGNTYSWDAENRLTQISYSGGNDTQFVYDALGRCIKIVETGSSPPYSGNATKQFIWCGNDRCEERDGSSALTKQFFALGQRNGSTNYFYTLDHLGSVREITDSGAGVQAQYAYDAYGAKTVIGTETVPAEFQYSGYYFHSRSGLNLTRTRAYSASLGRFISRDPIKEAGGVNLYAYVGNSPIRWNDPSGLGGPLLVDTHFYGDTTYLSSEPSPVNPDPLPTKRSDAVDCNFDYTHQPVHPFLTPFYGEHCHRPDPEPSGPKAGEPSPSKPHRHCH